MTTSALRVATAGEAPDRLSTERLWTPQDLSAYLQCKSSRTFRRVKKAFPRVPGVSIERYDPATVKAIVFGEATPAQRHRTVRKLRRADG